MKKESPSSVKTDNILENKKEIINIPTNEIKTFEEKTPEEYFDELNKTQDKHEKFEEYTKEFDNIIIEKDEATELINKENEEVLKKVEEIKEDKKKLETIINDNKEKEEKKEEPKEIIKEIKEVKKVIPIDENNIITKKEDLINHYVALDTNIVKDMILYKSFIDYNTQDKIHLDLHDNVHYDLFINEIKVNISHLKSNIRIDLYLTIKDKEKSIIATKSRDTILLKEDVTEQVKLMLELYEAKGSKLENLSVTGTKKFEDETIKQILVKIENMSLKDRYEFLTKLNYSEQEKQAINSYYEKLNKSKATDNITEEPKDEGLIDCSDENLKEAGDNLLEFLEEDKMKHRLQLN